jgi:3-deoxy-7-phosphoheptulonate synthase
LIIVTREDAQSKRIDHLITILLKEGIKPSVVSWKGQALLLTRRDPDSNAIAQLQKTNIVVELVRPKAKAQLASREFRNEQTVVDVGGVRFGGKRLVVIAGPCSVENRDQVLKTARAVKQLGACLLRGGAFKPRTSPYDFQGLGEDGLRLLASAREETGLPVVTEVLEPDSVDLVAKYADMLQIGARNMQNFPLLKRVGKTRKPVLLKRGMMATVEEWLHAAEYVLLEGNSDVVLCERGIRTFEKATRNTLDLAAIPVLRRETHLPVVVDPSHATGERELVAPMAKAAVAAGADGLMIETHQDPATALSDSNQQLDLQAFAKLMKELETVASAVGRSLR